jgi:putative ABC transport system permease protein
MAMMNRMIVANLRRRPVRSVVSILAVAIEVTLILMIVGLTNGMVNDSRNRVANIGADVVVRASSGAVVAQLNGNTLPVQLAAVFARVPGVAAVAPVAYHINGSIQTVSGVDLREFDAVSGGFRFLQGRAFTPGSHEVIVDDLQAASNHNTIGQTITLMGEPFTVVGIFEHGMGSRIFMSLDMLDRLAGSPGKAATFYIKLEPGASTAAVVAALRQLAPAETVDSIAQYLSLFTSDKISPALPIFQRVMVGIAVAIGFLVIFLSLYTTVLERTREIGILKSLGASRGYIIQAIVRESEVLAGLGVVAGAAISYGLWRALAQIYPTLTIQLTWTWVGWAAVIALGSSAIGALYPALKAASQDAISALAYE